MRRVRGFTLIELLFVVAIIGVLLAIATPVFRRVRKEAMRSACRCQLRQIGVASHQHATDHKLHVPLAGPMTSTDEEGYAWNCTPEGMGDPDRTRHVYYFDDNENDDNDDALRPVGIQAALASYLGHTVRLDSYAHLEEDQQKKTGVYDNFICPAQPKEPGLSVTVRQDNHEPWSPQIQGKWQGPLGYTTYAWNDAFSARWPGMVRIAGNIAQLTRPDRTVFMADSVTWWRDTEGEAWPCSEPWYIGLPTMWHLMTGSGGAENQREGTGVLHDWKLNTAFADGHAMSLRIGWEGDPVAHGDLLQAYLAAGIQGTGGWE